MFGINLGGLFTGPVDAVAHISDEKFKKVLERKALGLGLSQYMTFLEGFGQEFASSKWFARWARIARRMAAAFFKGISLDQDMKDLGVAVPTTLANDKVLLDSIYFEEFSNPKGV